MGRARLLLALAALLLLVGAGAAAYVAFREPSGGPGTRALLVEGPSGVLFDGPVHAETGTAFGVLRASGLAIETAEYPMGTYVVAIGGHRASGPAGWVYEVLRDGAWLAGDRSAADFAVHPGETVRWRWTS